MNRKSLLVLVIVLVAGVAFLLVRRGGSTAGDSNDEDQPVATLVTVQVGQLRPATLHAYVDGYGTVEPAPASADAPAASARVAPPLAGVVKRVHVAEGQQVRRGARLVDLDDRAAEVTVKYAAESAARQKELYAQHNTSLKALQDAEAQLATARAQLALLHVTAPLAGTVTALNARPGEAVDLTTVLAEITDLSRLVVSVQIPAADAAALKAGDALHVGSEPPVTATVAYVSRAVDPANGTVTVRAALPPGADLRSGSLVPVRIVTAEHANVLAAPADSVVTNDDGQTVVSVVNNDQATQVRVKTGFRDAGLVEVSGAGLKPGTTVVTVGAYGLPAKTQVRVVKP